MSLAIHADIGRDIGLGHLKRCLSIAEQLRKLSYQVEFVIDGNPYNKLIADRGFTSKKKIDRGQRYEMIIIDKYNLDEESLNSYKKKCNLLARIDDGAPFVANDRVSDVLINGNPYACRSLYEGFVKKNCYLIVGRKYIPMDEGFCQVRTRYRVRKDVNNISISFGSSRGGITNYAYNISKSLIFSGLNPDIFVLNGESLRNKLNTITIGQLDIKSKVKLLPFIDNIGSIFAKADIVICSASTTCWQLAAIGIPFIVFQIAANQSLIFKYVKRTKIGIALDNNAIHNGGLETEILRLTRSEREIYSERSRKDIDCRGSDRIANELDKLILGSIT